MKKMKNKLLKKRKKKEILGRNREKFEETNKGQKFVAKREKINRKPIELCIGKIAEKIVEKGQEIMEK